MANQFDQQVTFIYTSNLLETSRFYEDVLGLELVLEQSNCRIVKVCENAYLGYCERCVPEDKRGVILTFVTDNVDEWYDKLLNSGVQFEKSPAYHPDYNIYHCFFRDPNGYLLEIQRFLTPLS